MKQVRKLAYNYAHENFIEMELQILSLSPYESGFRKALELVVEYLKEKNSPYLFQEPSILEPYYLKVDNIKNLADKEVE
jgi:hypothetical protein